MLESISFGEAGKIMAEHGPQFCGPGVNGIGVRPIGDDDHISFIVYVDNEETRKLLSEKHKGMTISDMPVVFEVGGDFLSCIENALGVIDNCDYAKDSDSVAKKLGKTFAIFSLALTPIALIILVVKYGVPWWITLF